MAMAGIDGGDEPSRAIRPGRHYHHADGLGHRQGDIAGNGMAHGAVVFIRPWRRSKDALDGGIHFLFGVLRLAARHLG